MGVNINGFFRPTNLSRLKKCLSQVSRKSVFYNITITRAKINSMNIKFWTSTQNMVWSSGPHNPHFIILGLTSRSHCDVFLNSSLFLRKRAKHKSYLTFFSSYAVSIHLIRDLIKLGMEGTFSQRQKLFFHLLYRVQYPSLIWVKFQKHKVEQLQRMTIDWMFYGRFETEGVYTLSFPSVL